MPNQTMQKFGYPDTLIGESAFWAVLVRPQQVTLGSLVLIHKDPAAAFGSLTAEAFADLHPVVADIEAMLAKTVAYDRINYLMLMMVDPDVHFHVIPRYSGNRRFEGTSFPDLGWPDAPVLTNAPTPAPDLLARLRDRLREGWASARAGQPGG